MKHWHTLELPKILERLAAYASFSVGAEKARALTPSTDPAEIRERLATTTEARRFLSLYPQTDLGGARDVRPLVEAARREAVLTPPDLLDIAQTLQTARRLRQTVIRQEAHFPRLAAIAARLEPCPDLVEAVARVLDERGEVRDDASPALARIRSDLRAVHDRLIARLQRIISSPETAPFLQEPIITMREGRYVVPLKADFKGRIRGIVHDRSASGATLFIEPLPVVELGNTWRELQVAEEQEIRRILADLSARVAARGAEILETVDALADLDLAFAKARYADALDAVEPLMMTDGARSEARSEAECRDARSEARSEAECRAARSEARSEAECRHRDRLRLLRARHPLLDPATVVPIDVILEGDTHVLVITGPNTGGKTVTLKTVGLLALMAQSGLHIPSDENSALPVFAAVYADIGDEQSIEQSLSTFSAHLTNILSFIHRADEHSLVLLDELGAGTDPAEGSALARALLETFRQRGAITLVATHYPELKAYAQLTPGVCNACVEFDPETLRPTYRLTIGVPGRSNALAIARRLGLDEEIVRRAEALLSPQERQTEHLLADLHRLRLEAARARDEAYAARAEAQRLTEELRRRLARIDEERAAILEEARRQAQEELERLREEARTLRHQWRVAQDLSCATAELARLAAEVAESFPVPEPLLPTGPLRPGDAVWVKSLRAVGELRALADDEAEVQVGPLRARVPVRELERRAPPPPAVEPSGVRYTAPSVPLRLDLRGQTVEEALESLDRYLDAAALAGLPWAHIVHGKGTGALRQAVRDFLRRHPLVRSARPGEEGEGGDGVTVVVLEEPQ